MFISFLVSMVLILYLTWGIDFQKLFTTISNIGPTMFLVTSSIYLSTFLLRGIRWKFILSKSINVKTIYSIKLVLFGFLINNILPLRAGEVARSYILSKNKKVSFTFTLFSVMIEKIFDIVVLVLIFIFSSFFIGHTINAISNNFFYIEILSLITLFSVIIISGRKKILSRIIHFFTKHFSKKLSKKINESTDSILNALSFTREVSYKHLFVWIFTFSIWIIEAIVFYIYFILMNINQNFFVALIVLVIVNIGIIIPSAPGYIGVFEWFFVFTLSLFMIDKETALSVAIIIHLTQYITIALAGLISSLSLGIDFKEIKKRSSNN